MSMVILNPCPGYREVRNKHTGELLGFMQPDARESKEWGLTFVLLEECDPVGWQETDNNATCVPVRKVTFSVVANHWNGIARTPCYAADKEDWDMLVASGYYR